jgi:hypothetical protein
MPFNSGCPENIRIILEINEWPIAVTELLFFLLFYLLYSVLVGYPEFDFVMVSISIASKRIKFNIQLVVEVKRSEREAGHSPLSMTKLIITSNLFLPSLLHSS